jgi:hypothetical protein
MLITLSHHRAAALEDVATLVGIRNPRGAPKPMAD